MESTILFLSWSSTADDSGRIESNPSKNLHSVSRNQLHVQFTLYLLPTNEARWNLWILSVGNAKRCEHDRFELRCKLDGKIFHRFSIQVQINFNS